MAWQSKAWEGKAWHGKAGMIKIRGVSFKMEGCRSIKMGGVDQGCTFLHSASSAIQYGLSFIASSIRVADSHFEGNAGVMVSNPGSCGDGCNVLGVLQITGNTFISNSLQQPLIHTDR